MKLTQEQQEWYDSRPQSIKDLFNKIPPNSKWTMKETGKDYYIPYSYLEDGTLTVVRYNHLDDEPMFRVFGIKPEDLIKKEANHE